METTTRTTSTNNDEIQVPSSSRNHSIFDVLKESPQIIKPVKNEIDEYLDEMLSTEDQCPMAYWKKNQTRLPILSGIARKYLAIPASSAGVERIYSIAGAIARARRTRISVSNIANILQYRQYHLPGLKDKMLKRKKSSRLKNSKRKKTT